MSTDSWAVFGSAEYAFDSLPLTLTGEIRYAEDEVDGDALTFRARDQGGPVDISNPINPQTDFSTTESFTNTPWAVTAAYRFEETDIMGYLKVASSYRHGGMNLNQGSPGLELFPAELTYGEETSLTYEIGVKSSWFDRALTVNAAAFFTVYEEFLNTTNNGCPDQCQLVDDAGNGLGFNPDGSRVGEDAAGLPIPPNDEIPTAFFIDNVGEAEAWGYEVEGTYRTQFDYGATLLLNLGYAKGMGEVTSMGSNVAEATRAVADDADLPYLRPNQIKGSVVYRQPLGGLSDVRGFGGSVLVASATYAFEEGGVRTLNNSAARAQDAVRRLNAHVGLETDNWSLFVRGDNLTDHAYETWSNATLYLRNPQRYVYGEFTYRFQ
jgi:outer membrane receptor protein involved in Fe transport